jgi:hypothetical protein
MAMGAVFAQNKISCALKAWMKMETRLFNRPN